MTGGPIQRKTKLFGFNIIRFDFARWHEFEHQNWDALDANLAQLGLVSNAGVWDNNTAYLIGDRVVDTDYNTIYMALVAHSSPSTGTFAEYRTANPNHWRPVSAIPNYRGDYADGVAYYAGDIAKSGYVYKLSLQAYDSVAGSFNNAAYWVTVFDGQPLYDAVIAARDTTYGYRTATQQLYDDTVLVAGQAMAFRNTAEQHKNAAATSATNAATSEGNALSYRNTTLGYRDTAFGYRNEAEGFRNQANTSATNAATSEANAAASWASFSNIYHGPRTTDPTTDPDGSAVDAGDFYFNTVQNIVRFRKTDGTWSKILTDAPEDGDTYGRKNGEWVKAAGAAQIQDTAPATGDVGTFWWSSLTGQLAIRYNDGNSTQWVGLNGSLTSAVMISDNEPTSSYHGLLWWSSLTGELFIRYNDGDTEQWVSAFGGAAAGDIYSTSETATSKKWIDGKTIYRKVVDCGAMPNATSKLVAHGIVGWQKIIDIKMIVSNTTGQEYVAYFGGDGGAFISTTNIDIRTTTNRSTYNGIAVIEYTKV